MASKIGPFTALGARFRRWLSVKLRRLHLHRLVFRLISKELAELDFQRLWVLRFAANPEKARTYWEKYRYLGDILERCDITPESKVLDVGCGISTVLHFLPGDRHGIDPLADEYHKLYEYPEGISVTQAPGEHIPFPDDTFDFVFCSNVLDHVSDPPAVLAEIARTLKPDGRLILTVELFDHTGHGERSSDHPHQFDHDGAVRAVSRHFTVEFEGTSPWVSLYHFYGNKDPGHRRKELILLARPEDN